MSYSNQPISSQFSIARLADISFILRLLCALAGLGLSIIAWMKLCSEECAESTKYRVYGMHFELIGMFFFTCLAIIIAFSRKHAWLYTLSGILVAGALGGEVWLIYSQKYIIHHWCPVCLSIAFVLVLMGAVMTIEYCTYLKEQINRANRGEVMKSIQRGIGSLLMFSLGFLLVFLGFGKINELEAAENAIKQNIAFGDKKSNIEIYLFTDWACPSCRKLEPMIEEAAPEIMKQARLIFVDLPVHANTLNFTPYNLSFMLKNKGKYLELRHALGDISQRTGEPTEQEIEQAAAQAGVHYQQLNYADVVLGSKYFKQLANQFKVDATPTMIIVNVDTKKGKKLEGNDEITRSNIFKAIKNLK